MVAKHEIGYVPPPNVVVGLLALNKLIVLGDDVDGSGVGADGAESGDRSEDEGVEAPEVVDQVVGGEDGNVVEDLVEPDAGVVHEDGPQGVEELDDEVEDVFVPFVLGWEFGLPGQRQVGVPLYLVQKVVVVGVVPAERNGARNSHRDIADHSQNLIDGHVGVAAPVHKIVYAAVQGMVEQPAYQVGIQQDYPHRLVLHALRGTLAQ